MHVWQRAAQQVRERVELRRRAGQAGQAESRGGDVVAAEVSACVDEAQWVMDVMEREVCICMHTHTHTQRERERERERERGWSQAKPHERHGDAESQSAALPKHVCGGCATRKRGARCRARALPRTVRLFYYRNYYSSTDSNGPLMQ